MRFLQLELMRMLIGDLSLRNSPGPSRVSPETRRRNIFTNLILKYLELGYEIGYIPEQALKLEMTDQFRDPEIRTYWEKVRSIYMARPANRTQRQFTAIVDEAYAAAPSAAPAPKRQDQRGAEKTDGRRLNENPTLLGFWAAPF